MLTDRTFHPDEANQAFTTGKLLESGAYAYQPQDHHGPTLYYAGAALQKMAGHDSTVSLDGTLLRCTPLVFAILAIVFGALAVRKAVAGKRNAAIVAPLALVAFLGTAPAFAFFSTFYIQEMLLASFLLMAFWAALKKNGFFFGLAAGLAFATKETSLISFAAAAAAFVAVKGRDAFKLPEKTLHPVVAAATFALVSVALYSSFCSNWQGVRDAVVSMPLSYFHRAAGDAASTGAADHVHPWYQHFKWIFASGWKFSELALLVPVCAALPSLLRKRGEEDEPARRTFLFTALYTAILLALYSAIPYKTPWCDLQIVVGLAVAAALATPFLKSRAIACAAIVVVLCCHVVGVVAINSNPDSRAIPFNYAHSSPDVKRAAELIEKEMANAGEADFVAVGVPASDTWPLPWYLRSQLARTGYWTSADELKAVADAGGKPKIVVVPEADADKAAKTFPHLKRSGIYATRPGVLLTVMY